MAGRQGHPEAVREIPFSQSNRPIILGPLARVVMQVGPARPAPLRAIWLSERGVAE